MYSGRPKFYSRPISEFGWNYQRSSQILAAQFDVSGPTLTASLAAVQESTGSIGTLSFTRGDLRLNSVVKKCFKKCLVVVLSGSNGFKLCIFRITGPEQDLQ